VGVQAGAAVVLTRAAEDNAALAVALRGHGIDVLELPCTATRLLPETALPRPVAGVLLGSRRGVTGLVAWPAAASWLSSGGPDGGKPLLGAVGAATAARLEQAGWRADVVATPATGAALAREVAARLASGARVAVVRGTLSSGEPEDTLQYLGMAVVPVVVYENVAPTIDRLAPRPVAAVLAAAPSAVRRLLDANPWLAAAPFVVPGETTATAVRALGVADVRSVGTDTAAHLVALLAAWQASVEG
jgi:uroporphyrinogen-III synthase